MFIQLLLLLLLGLVHKQECSLPMIVDIPKSIPFPIAPIITDSYNNSFSPAHGSRRKRQTTLSPFVSVYRYRIKGVSYDFHFYTNSAAESQSLSTNPSFYYEGITGCMPTAPEGPATVAIYRLYNTVGYTHMYAPEAERNSLIASNTHWVDEGKLGYCSPTPQPYMAAWQRFYNTLSYDHIFTASAAEITDLRTNGVAKGWVAEGTQCFIYSTFP